jgi:hypothetical protein
MNEVVYGRRLIDEKRRYRRWIDPRVWSLPLAAVVAYLRQGGWKEIPPGRPHFLVFAEPPRPEGEPSFVQFVPTFEREPGFGQQMLELLTGLAEFEDRQAAEVIDDILRLASPGQDGNGAAASPAVPAETTPERSAPSG